jgi:hypothetical protein
MVVPAEPAVQRVLAAPWALAGLAVTARSAVMVVLARMALRGARTVRPAGRAVPVVSAVMLAVPVR